MARRSKSPSRRAGTPISGTLGHATAAARPPRAPPRRARPLWLVGARRCCSDRRAARPHAGLRAILSMLRACPPGRHLELLRKNPQGVGIVVGARAHDRARAAASRLATAVATINMAHTFPNSNHAALWLTALAAGTDSAVCRALLGVGYRPPAPQAECRFHAPGDGLHGRLWRSVCAARGRVWAADARRRGGGVRRARRPAVCRDRAYWRPRHPAAPQSRRAASGAALHAPTALIVFYDFGSVALAVLWPDLLWFQLPRALRESLERQHYRRGRAAAAHQRRAGIARLLRAQALRAALLVAAALRLRRGVWFAASRPRGRRRCGVLGLAAAVWLAVQCAATAHWAQHVGRLLDVLVAPLPPRRPHVALVARRPAAGAWRLSADTSASPTRRAAASSTSRGRGRCARASYCRAPSSATSRGGTSSPSRPLTAR